MRGGARPGAGRKAEAGVRQAICVRVSPVTIEIIDKLKGNSGVGQLIDKAIACYDKDQQ